MKMAIPCWALAGLTLVCGLVEGAGAPRRVERTRLAGREYVSVGDWARANGFELRWLKRDDTLQLAKTAAVVTLQIHSPEARINGVEVRLLFPLVQRPEAVFISALDLDTTFRPVLWPPKDGSGRKVSAICLDPGHGGKDPGFEVGHQQEKKFTLLLAKELQSQLQRAGFKVSSTRATDRFLELADRPDLARRRRTDLLISLHFNATQSGAGSVQGAEVYCLTPAGAPSSNAGGEGGGAGWFPGNHHNELNMFLAYQLQKALTRAAGAEDRGVHRARFLVLREALMPAVLIEAGYMSHPVEGRKIFTASYRRQLAAAIVQGVLAYKHVVER